jgi:hypothetical protein
VTMNVGGEVIKPTKGARNIGVVMDDTLSMHQHIRAITSTMNYHLRNIYLCRKCLTRQSTEQLVHALISSRLDYANALFIHFPKSALRPLQLTQNTAARLVTGAGRRDHVTPLLASLHWLTVRLQGCHANLQGTAWNCP